MTAARVLALLLLLAGPAWGQTGTICDNFGRCVPLSDSGQLGDTGRRWAQMGRAPSCDFAELLEASRAWKRALDAKAPLVPDLHEAFKRWERAVEACGP